MYANRQYSAIFDHPQPAGRDAPSLWFSGYNTIDKPFKSERSKSAIKAAVTERPGVKYLSFSYQLSVMNEIQRKGSLRPLYLSPGAIAVEILLSFGLITCPADPDKCSQQSIISCQNTPAGMRIGAHGSWDGPRDDVEFGQGIVCCMSQDRQEDALDKWIAVYLLRLREKDSKLLVRQQQCLDCCARAAWEAGQPLQKQLRLQKNPDRVVVQLVESQSTSILYLN